jgi:PST family polysaccharide transporter
VRVLTPATFGLVSFIQGIMQYFIILTEYGFNLSATQNVSIHRDDPSALSHIFMTVLSLKLLFSLISMIILFVLILFVPKLGSVWCLCAVSFLLVVANVLSPRWFYQGIEQMKYITAMSILGKLLYTVLIFTFVKHQNNYLYVPLFQSLSDMIPGVMGIGLLFFYFRIRISRPTLSDMVHQIKDGWYIFISMAAFTLYGASNTVILGFMTNASIVGYYAASERIIRAVQSLMLPINQTVYPYLCRLVTISANRALLFIHRLFVLIGFGTFVTSLLLFIFAHPIVGLLLGKEYHASILIFRILAFLPFISSLSNIAGTQTMVTFKFTKRFSAIIVKAAALNIMLVLALAPRYLSAGAAAALITTELWVLISSYYFLVKRQLFSKTMILRCLQFNKA